MSLYKNSRRARRVLDARLANLDTAALDVPRRGWIRTVSDALGMTTVDLAARLGVTRQAVYALETSEISGNVKLETLRRAATALDCQLVYALVPQGGSLEGIVLAEGGRLVDIEHAAVAQTMALEGQAVDTLPTDRADAIDDLIRSGRLWASTR